jgi:acetylxylan esterase
MYSPGPSTPSLIFENPPRPYNILSILQALAILIGLVIAQGCDIPSNFTCVSGAQIIAVRGSLEPQGPGIIGAVAQQIMAAIPDSDMMSLRYPAIYEPYKSSQIEGVEALALAIWQYAAVCPDTKMILLGYSQVSQIECNNSSHRSGFCRQCADSPI